MEKIKIKAIIGNVNGGFAYVLNRDIEYTYTKIDEDTIIGEDEGVLKFYEHDGRIYDKFPRKPTAFRRGMNWEFFFLIIFNKY